MDRVIVYIDGFNLYFGLVEKGWRQYLWLDPWRLSEMILKADQSLVGVKYFTSRVAGTPSDPDKPRRQNAFLEAIQTVSGVEIFYGHYLAKSVKCKQCGNCWTTHEEKMTDVNIAVKMLEDAQANRFDTAILISADSDLTGPIKSVRENHSSKRVVVAFPPERNSIQLQKVSHGYFQIGRKKFSSCQFPEEVVKADGYRLRRPLSWK